MLDKILMDKIRAVFDEISLPPRYLYARMPDERAPVRLWLPPRPGKYERRRVKQFRDLGFSVRIWSPMAEPNF